MADNEWGNLEAQLQVRLQDQKVQPVPEPIIKAAQRAVDGVPHPGEPDKMVHAFQWEAPTIEQAEAFRVHLRHAGVHTKPKSSITAVRDPDRKRIVQLHPETGEPVLDGDGKPVKVLGEPVNPRLVAWRAGQRRGRAT